MTALQREAYWVTSADTEPERCDPGLDGLGTAMSKARFASRGGKAVQVCVTWNDGSGQELFEYVSGQQTYSSSDTLVLPADDGGGAAVYDLTARLGQPRRARKPRRHPPETPSWPGIDVTSPPCET